MVSKTKRKTIKRNIKRIGGDGDGDDKSVYISYIKNTTTQVLMNILSPYEKEHPISSRFSNSHKTNIIGVWAKKVGLTDDEFKTSADNIINLRNKIIHPSAKEDLAKITEISLNIIYKHNLIDDCNLESKILNYYIETINKPKSKTRKNYTYISSKAI